MSNTETFAPGGKDPKECDGDNKPKDPSTEKPDPPKEPEKVDPKDPPVVKPVPPKEPTG